MRLMSINGERGRVAVNLKLGRVTYVTGPNGSGKTTLLDLIRFGLEGPARTSQPSPVSVALRFGDEHRDACYLVREAVPGQPQQVEAAAPGIGRTQKVREAEQVIAQAVGTAWTWNASALLFGATAPERRKALGTILGPSIGRAVVLEALRAAEVGYSDLSPRLAQRVNAAAVRIRSMPEDSGPEAAGVWLDALRTAKTAAQNEAEAARKTVETVEGRVAAAGAIEGSVDLWTVRAQEASDEVAKLRRVQAEETHLVALRTERERERDRTAAALATEKKREAIAEQQRRIIAARQALATLADGLDAPHAALLLADVAAQTTSQAAAEAHARYDAAVAVDRRRAAANELREDIELVLGPADASLFEDSREAAERLRRLLEPAEGDPVAAAKAEAAGAATQARAAEAAARRALTAHDDWTRKASEAKAVVDRLEAELAQVEAQHARTLPQLEAAATTAQKALDDTPLPVPSEHLASAIDAARVHEDAVKETLRRVTAYSVLVADRDRAIVHAQALAADRQDLHQVEKKAEKAIGELYRAAVEPLVGPASQITRAVLGGDVEIDPGAGWWIGVGGEPVEHLSESARAVLGIALHVAVVQQQASGWKAVLLDGAEALEDSRRIALLRALAAAPVDTVIVCAVDDGIYPELDSVDVVKLGSPAWTIERGSDRG